MKLPHFQFKVIIISCSLSSLLILGSISSASAAQPTPGNWSFIKGISPTQVDQSLIFIVGTIDSSGALVNWKLGSKNLQGTYNSVTGKISFSDVHSPNEIGYTTYSGFYFKKTPCFGGDLPTCTSYMVGTWSRFLNSQGWYAYLNSFN